ncbi:methylenetetrahydrofolate reductase [Cereibacter sphaeroides]|uniref:methylenetetrahydrofolate reductase n=1 Tax=Cereibacter sphaeroides TaxID=1063 RepID=UPI000191CD11|nr:methylenetetrahydrofolate reductase [Cereibacter sphaeroides]ACM03770.1 Methylenetetrahydrofolate reductase [Cereibacter sphaeroides KD131]
MATTDPSPLPARLGPRSIEITAKDTASRRAVIEGLPEHTEVFVADLPDQPPEVVLEAAAEIRSAGLEPVPHLVARNLSSADALDAVLRDLRRMAQVRSVFVTGGDRDEPSGPFASALDLLGTGLLQRHGLTRLAFAGYPEGHPRIPTADLEEALRRKLAAARAGGFETLLISQFAFDAAPVVAMARRLRSLGLMVPLRVGTAGPADRHTLAEFARDLGAGHSAERLDHPASDPAGFSIERFAAALADAQAQEPALGLEGLHLFPFGSTEASVGWLRQQR